MKALAYLISAYTEPKSLEKLVKALNMECADFYIHIDKKVDITNFKKRLSKYNNVFFLPDSMRVKVYWGGMSQVVMQYNMIKEMMESKINYVRVINLTGTDYPVAPNQKLYDVFMDTSKEYIIGFDVGGEIRDENSIKEYPHSEKFLRIWLMDGMGKGCSISKQINDLHLKKRKCYSDLGYKFYLGSEYWALTYECVCSLMRQYDKEKKLQRILKYSFAPSEAWMHTLFFNSKYRKKSVTGLKRYYTGLISLSPISYFEYNKSIKILNESDIDKIVASKRLFARKVIVGRSSRLIRILDELRNTAFL